MLQQFKCQGCRPSGRTRLSKTFPGLEKLGPHVFKLFGIVKQLCDTSSNLFRGGLLLNKLRHNLFAGNQVDKSDVLDLDHSTPDPVT